MYQFFFFGDVFSDDVGWSTSKFTFQNQYGRVFFFLELSEFIFYDFFQVGSIDVVLFADNDIDFVVFFFNFAN